MTVKVKFLADFIIYTHKEKNNFCLNISLTFDNEFDTQ
ncbi:hypothetical protein SAMN05216438_1341 [Lactococcus garvieae]|uniref:Uncharacterized protein n=1 Tax=Lactococcus garvieae TaxID=1363 RepID=A0A1I4J607_9LACT|nr:hypothetical protein SAMN05216438_1341 [Lactococcus garvieae]